MVKQWSVALCAAMLLTPGCRGDPKPSSAAEQFALDGDVTAWAQSVGAISGWEREVGPFSLQVERALLAEAGGKPLLLKGVSVADVMIQEGVYYALLGWDPLDVLIDSDGGSPYVRFLVSCSDEDGEVLIAQAQEIALESGPDYRFSERSVLDAGVEVTAVRRVAGFELEARPDGDSAFIGETARNRFVASGKLVAYRMRPHPFWSRSK